MKFKNYSYPEDFYFANNQIFLTKLGRQKSVKYRRKITGSRMAAVIGRNKYKSPFQCWCEMLGFVEIEIEPFFAEAGVVIEKTLLKYAEKELNKNFTSYNSKEVGYDIFQDTEIFGGIPDGEEFSGNSVQSIIEIKTTPLDKYCYTFEDNELKLVRDSFGKPIIKELKGNLHKWFSLESKELKIPEEYQFQLALYLYLRKIEKGYFCIAFLNKNHYLKPESFEPKAKEQWAKEEPQMIIIDEMKINLNAFQRVIDYAKEWYQKYIVRGISPPLTPQDLNWIRFGFPSL
ncbi:recombinase [Mycoplasma wenyonii]|uniref:Recombinase n=1 Tax=Mycoplasma wenyonii TaxID=65123 RepID=A0A328PK40_9MOLU|nr:YqaJ viral recombinase family protein [Mycoplasma wenyonii]RAO95212.1 recombinase [Mycoplasma wenyonii]